VLDAVSDKGREVSVSKLLELFGISKSTFYRKSKDAKTAHTERDEELMDMILKIHDSTDGTYGAPRIYAELKGQKVKTSKKRIARLMRELGIQGVMKKHTKKGGCAPETDGFGDLVKRNFSADEPNRLWVSDITYIKYAGGTMYLAIVLDLFSRKIVGFSADTHMRASLVGAALSQALYERDIKGGLVFHSDHGGQYRSKHIAEILEQHGVSGSMGSIASPGDNALAEAFMSTFKAECARHLKDKSAIDAQIEIFSYIAGFYNNQRRHSKIDYLSPAEYERKYYEQADNARSVNTNVCEEVHALVTV
jgi:transposase InsO family protein